MSYCFKNQDFMDGIITILIIAAAIIFKVVGKKMDSAPGEEVFPQFPFNPEPAVETSSEDEEAEDTVAEEGEEEPFFKPEIVTDELVIEEAKAALPVQPSVQKPVAPILVEEEPAPKEKIDPKKLIIYSEIMKPKYNE